MRLWWTESHVQQSHEHQQLKATLLLRYAVSCGLYVGGALDIDKFTDKWKDFHVDPYVASRIKRAMTGDVSAQFDIARHHGRHIEDCHSISRHQFDVWVADGLPWLLKSARGKFPPAMIMLSDLLRKGDRGVPRDDHEADRLLYELVDANNVDAMLKLGGIYLQVESDSSKYREAIRLFDRAAKQVVKTENIDSVLKIGCIYLEFELGSDEHKEGIRLLEWAANLDSVRAHILLSDYFGKKDRKQSILWLETALGLDSADCYKTELCVRLARKLLSGTRFEYAYGEISPSGHSGDVDKSLERARVERAVSLLREIAEEETDTCYEFDDYWSTASGALASILLGAVEAHRDVIEGERFLRKLAALADPWALNRLAGMLMVRGYWAWHRAHPRGLARKKMREAENLWLQLAESSHLYGDYHSHMREAANQWHNLIAHNYYVEGDYRKLHVLCVMLNYANCNLLGVGIGCDLREAMHYFEGGANNGDAEAQLKYARLTVQGLDHVHGELGLQYGYWAMALGVSGAKEVVVALEKQFSKVVIEKVRRLAREGFIEDWHLLNKNLSAIRESFVVPFVQLDSL